MTRTRLLWLAPILLVATLSTRADTASVYVNGSFAFANNGYGIGPYGGTLNGQNASFYCVDFSHDITGNSGWTANVSYLNGGSLAGTLLKSQTTYSEMAWLITQMMNPAAMAALTGQSNLQNVEAELQWTIWAMSGLGGTSNPYSYWTGYFYSQAAGNYKNVAGSWEILTPGGDPTKPGYYGQEFMVLSTPEPSILLLLFMGLAALALLALKK